MKKTVIFSLLVIFAASTSGYAQEAGRGGGGQRASREDGLDPTPIDPAKDPNVGMFINDYRNAKPRLLSGQRGLSSCHTELKLSRHNPQKASIRKWHQQCAHSFRRRTIKIDIALLAIAFIIPRLQSSKSNNPPSAGS